MDTNVLEDIPLRAANPLQFARGYYPLRWERDYLNYPAVANTSAVEQTVHASVVAGGKTYVFPKTKIAPGATAVFDVDSLRANNTPDLNGATISRDAIFGKFHWNSDVTSTVVGLIGRNELRSTQDRRASSFSCGGTCQYTADQFPLFDVGPGGSYDKPYSSPALNVTAQELYQDSYGNPTYYPNISTDAMGGLSVNNTAILTATPQSNGYVMQEDTHDPGSTTVSWYFRNVQAIYYDDQTPCNFFDEGQQQSTDAFVRVPAATSIVGSTYSGLYACGPANNMTGHNRVVYEQIVDQQTPGQPFLANGIYVGERITPTSRDDFNWGVGTQTGSAPTSYQNAPGSPAQDGVIADSLFNCDTSLNACTSGGGGGLQSILDQQDLYDGLPLLTGNSLSETCTGFSVNGR